MAKKRTNCQSPVLCQETVGTCTIKLLLYKRNINRYEDGIYPLAVRFTINDVRYYHKLGDSFSEKEFEAIIASTGQGEKHADDSETRYQIKTRLTNTFRKYVEIIKQLDETGALSLDRIKTGLTGKCQNNSFVEMWSTLIQEKRDNHQVGTADSYQAALRSFKLHTGITKKDGFAVDSTVVQRWIEKMIKAGNKQATIGIYLRAMRYVINVCISDGYMPMKNKIFGLNVNRKEKISIPVGGSRKEEYLSIEKMTELYNHWKEKDLDLPQYLLSIKNPPYAVKTTTEREKIYQSLGMFLVQYFCCGCNLEDVSSMEYNDFYFNSGERCINFIRKKTGRTANNGEGIEVIVPIIEPLKEIMDIYAAKPEKGALIFPSVIGEYVNSSDEDKKARIKQQNHNIGDRMKKIALSLGWSEALSSTYARHSFATNLNSKEVPREYIKDAMGHTMENRGDITQRYISAYTIEKRMYYNNMLLSQKEEKEDVQQQQSQQFDEDEERQELIGMLDNFSNEELQKAIMKMQNDKLKAMRNS